MLFTTFGQNNNGDPHQPRTENGAAAAIGRFLPLRCVGQGGQGVVYPARDPDLDRLVAIKTMSRRGCDKERLTSEACNVAKLQHPNVVTLFEMGVHEGAPFLVYRYAEGSPPTASP